MTIKICPCCGREYDLEGFRALADGGYQDMIDTDIRLEQHHCTCKSTIGIFVAPDGTVVDDLDW
jgi:hypothetical protein